MNTSLDMPAKKKKPAKIVRAMIGWREWAGLPDFDIGQINAKIDTGAKTSAIHAFRIREVMSDGCEYA